MTDAARRVFTSKEQSLLARLLGESSAQGFLGPVPIEEHMDHSTRLAVLLERAGVLAGSALDLGSGGGIPGLVLATYFRELSFTFLDSQRRRCEFLNSASVRLSLELDVHCAVVHGRAEECARQPTLDGAFDIVVARSFGPPAVVSECAIRFLRVGGRLVVTEPPRPDATRWQPKALLELGFELVQQVSEPLPAVILVRMGAIDETIPRQNGVPRRKPLW